MSAALQALAGKCALLILDGTEEADNLSAVLQVRERCGVLITSRTNEDAVADYQDIAPLHLDNAVELLQMWGKTFAADEQVCQHICAFVGRLPLAVRLVGRYLFQRKQPAERYFAWLQTSPLKALDQGKRREQSVPILLEQSIKQVSEAAQHALTVTGILALAPFDPTVVAKALDISRFEAEDCLGELVSYGLLKHSTNRYEVSHALIHTYASKRLTCEPNVVTRLAGYYEDFAREQRQQGLAGYARLDQERAHIMQVLDACQQREAWQAVSDLVKAICKYLDIRGYWTEYRDALDSNLKAARQQADRKDEGWCLGQLGYNATKRGDYTTALQYLEQSLAIRRAIGDRAGESVTCWNIGMIYQDQGDLANAEAYVSRTVQIDEEIGHPDLERDRAALERIRQQRQQQGTQD